MVTERVNSVKANLSRVDAGGGEGEGSVEACEDARDAADVY